jgi:hypothetical protein
MLVELAHMYFAKGPDEHFEKLLKIVSFGLILVIFTASLVLGRRGTPGSDDENGGEEGTDPEPEKPPPA